MSVQIWMSCQAATDRSSPSSCDNCDGREIEAQVIQLCRDAALYGWYYRRAIENDVAQNRHRHRAMSVPEWLQFAAVAAASGVIGNAVYDAIKALVILFVKKAATRLKASEKAAAKRFVENDIDAFISAVSEYARDGGRGLPSEIQLRIYEERLTWSVTDVLFDAKGHKGPKPSREEVERLVRTKLDSAREPATLTPELHAGHGRPFKLPAMRRLQARAQRQNEDEGRPNAGGAANYALEPTATAAPA
jgi:hypothetical protein